MMISCPATTSSSDERANAGPDSSPKEADEKLFKADKQHATSVVREMADPGGQRSNDCPEPDRGYSRPDYESLKGATPRSVHGVTMANDEDHQ
jgi:hypothetical protein